MALSTINTNSIADDAVTVPKVTDQVLTHRNLIINGAMQVAQRGTSETGVGGSSGYFTCDRWRVSNTTDGRYTLEQSAVTDLDGISSALKFSCTTADTSVAAGDNIILSQRMEGFNTQSLKSSSTSMKSFTLSFYAKSNASRVITSDVLFTNGTNRLAAKAHTIGTSWQKYTMTVPAASSTQLDNDNTNNLQLNFWLHAGSDFTSGTLSTTLGPNVSANRAAGIGSLVASTSNTFEITGVQLELGSQATPFEHRSYGEELALCHRYYQIILNATPLYNYRQTGNSVAETFTYINEMRATPSFTLTRNSTIFGSVNTGAGTDGLGIYGASTTATALFIYQNGTDVSAAVTATVIGDAEL
jgi:hypothetical protein